MRILIFLLLGTTLQAGLFQIGRLHYSGGGDWYVGESTIPNLSRALQTDLHMQTSPKEKVVRLEGDSIYEVDVLYATGHGRIDFSQEEAYILRDWLLAGGFLLMNDSYGMDEWVRDALKKVFPEYELQPIHSSHPIYNSFHQLEGLPKIHAHDEEPAQGYGIFHEGRLVLFYAYSSDIGDGMEDPGVHPGDTPQSRAKALKMGVNLIYFHLNPQEWN